MPLMRERLSAPSMAASRPPPFFVGDDLALDFLNTVAAPADETIEWLAGGLDLVQWLAAAHAVPSPVVAEFRKESGVRALDAAASEARELREWFRGFIDAHAGKPIERGALRELTRLNELLAHDGSYRQIELAPSSDKREGDDHGVLQWGVRRRWRNARSLLLPIAEAMGDLVCRKDLTLVRRCEGPSCTLWFLDVSKAHARRWCSMALCGNRAKAAAHRARQRNAAKP
jgi:predicted RNA-binding Zn ribbon-like protein